MPVSRPAPAAGLQRRERVVEDEAHCHRGEEKDEGHRGRLHLEPYTVVTSGCAKGMTTANGRPTRNALKPSWSGRVPGSADPCQPC